LDDIQLAGLILKGMTAQYLLHRTHKVQPGDFVLIHAAAGGMGHKTFPLRDAAAAHRFIGARKTTGSIVMLPFE